MVRSTAISWKIGLAAAALALPLSHGMALADDAPVEKVEPRPQPLEPKTVRIILMPPANDSVFTSPRPEMVPETPVIMMQPAGSAATVEPFPEASEPEPSKIEEDVALVESPLVPDRPALVPLVSGAAAIASPPPEPPKAQKGATLVAIPSLPKRSPFRQAPFKSELVDFVPNPALQQPEPAPVKAKSNSTFSFLGNLWPGKKQASTPVSSTADGTPVPAGNDRSDSTASASAQAEQIPAEADEPTTKEKAAKFLNSLQFWKN